MADKETDLKLTVGAVADKSSAKKAAQDIAKEIDNSVKGGRIDISVPINIDKKQLTDAQNDVVREIAKLTSKGVSASGKDIDKLNSKFDKFKQEFKNAGEIQKYSDVFQQIKKEVKAIEQGYKNVQKLAKSTAANPPKVKNNKSSTKKDIYEAPSDTKSRRGRTLTGPNRLGSTPPKGYKKNSFVDPSRTSEYEAKMSELSSYRSGMARQMRQSEKETRKDVKDSLTVRVNKEEANRLADEAIARSRKRQLSPQEKAGQLSDDLRKNILPDLLTKIQSSENETEVGKLTENFFDTLETISKLNQDAGKLIFSDVKKDIGIAIGKYFNTSGNIGGTDGTDKTEGSRDPKIVPVLKGLLAKIEEKQDAIKAELIKLEQLEKASPSKSKTTREINNFANRVIAETRVNKEASKQGSQEISQAVVRNQQAIENQTEYDKIEHSAERVADSAEGKKNQDIINDLQEDLGTGFNTDSKADEAIEAMKTSKGMENLKDMMCPCEVVLQAILSELQNITKNGVNNSSKALKEIDKVFEPAQKALSSGVLDILRNPDGTPKNIPVKTHYTAEEVIREKKQRYKEQRILEEDAERNKGLGLMQRSMIETSIVNPFKKLKANYEKIMAATSKEQDEMAAQRIREYGIGNSYRPTDSGDKIRFARRMSFWRNSDTFGEMFKNFKLTPGVKIDTTEITSALAKVLSGPEMFKAQSGGWKNNLAIAATGGLASFFQPSLEKSRAQADAVNTIMANIRESMNTVLQDILNKESALSDMQEKGDITFNADGTVLSGTGEAKTLALQLEESKLALASILADAGMVDDVVAKTGGRLSEIVKQLGFTSPMLRKNNIVLANINAGLDKTGKALKFQRRSQEILNYSFQLMSRHIGQVLKRWLLMLNPINLIKKAFSDFASYDVKWQRTMNVLKYNFRRIIRPAMQWIAQQLVNMLGLVNALVKGIGKAFGQDWDLFDKEAADAEKMREELEAAANVTAGFDELHDIGGDSSSNAAMDFSGDIYTPQWEGLNKVLEDIGETIGKIVGTVKDWNFWTWLTIAGAALAGFLVLKWLINTFNKGKNPLHTVAEGFSFLEKAVGWAILILALTEFTKALTDFVECMKTADWEDIVKSLLMLAGAFAELYLTAGGLMYLSNALSISASTLLGTAAIAAALALFTDALTDFVECMKSADWEDIVKSLLMLAGAFAELVIAAGGLMIVASSLGALAPQMLGLAVVIAAFAPVIWALSAFVEAIKGLTSEDMLNGLMFLAGAFMAIAVAIGVLLVVLSAAIASGIGAVAILALAGIIAVISLVILSLAELVRAMGEAGAGIKLICEGIAEIINAVGDIILGKIQIIMDFIDSVIGKIIALAATIVHEIGETIRTVIKTVGDVILGIIHELLNAIPNLLRAILEFVGGIGPAIERTANSIMRTITKVVNFTVSAVEYLINLVVDGVNGIIGSINSLSQYVGINIPRVQKVTIARFVPQYEQGTNYVPSDGLAYLHQGEAVIPKKYNQPYQQQGMSQEERAYMAQMLSTMRSLDGTMKQGIRVNGQFTQRGSDLVAVVNKTNSQTGSDLLSNVAYAR